MVRNSTEMYRTMGPDEHSFLQDPMAKSLLSLFAANSQLDEAMMEEVSYEEQERLRQGAAKLEKIKDVYRKVQNARVKETLRFPRAMSMPARLQNLCAEDVQNGEDAKSALFVQLQEKLRSGTLTEGDDEVRLNEERQKVIYRVICGSDAMFSTLAACGEEPVRFCGSRPDFMFLEESSQITIPSALVGLQHAPKHACVVGDLAQIEPHKASGAANVAWKNFSRSILDYLYHKGIRNHECRIQFRIPPECMEWPNIFFYAGKVENGPNVNDAHPNKTLVKELSLDYGVKGEKGHGSPFFVVNVPGGIALKEEGGNSIENYGEAEAALKAIDRLVMKGMDPEEISVISYYRGQVKTVNLLSKRKYPQTVGFASSTVDQAQGDTKSVVIITVGASAFNDINQMYRNMSEEVTWRISTHAKLASRLCVALTRARHGTVVFCNAYSLATAYEEDKSTDPLRNGFAWHDLLIFAEAHGLIAKSNLQDTNPRLGGESWNPDFQIKMQKKVEHANNMAFLAKHRTKTALLRDKLQHKTMKQAGLKGPTFSGRKGTGSGVTQNYPGPWVKAAIRRQFAKDAVLQETSSSKVGNARRRPKKSKAERAEQENRLGTSRVLKRRSAKARMRLGKILRGGEVVASGILDL